jgi:multidrug efflux system membrane fusion protein
MNRSERFRALALGAVLAAAGLAGCQEQEDVQKNAAAREITYETVTPERLQLNTQLPGRVEAVRVAQIRARVAGIVTKRLFEEGAEVKAGDLLFEIDPAPLRAALTRALGELAKAGADVEDARSKLARYKPLVKINAVSQENFDTASATLERAKAAHQTALADVETARLNLGYAFVKAPISGKIGRAMVTEGALVGQGEATLMAVIQQLDPIYVDFTQPASEAIRIKDALDNGTLVANKDDRLKVQIAGTRYSRDGALMFSDVAVDPSTGQTTSRGRFANGDRVLLPGMYVRVTVPQGVEANAVLVPQKAIERDRSGQAQVWVVNEQNQVMPRPVQTGDMHLARWQITQGLNAGDRIVVSNLAGLNAGDTVIPAPAASHPHQASTD